MTSNPGALAGDIETYILSGEKPMLQDWQQRVVDELDALREKGQKLGLFLTSDAFKALPLDDQYLLQKQAAAMITYASILRTRINRFQMGGETLLTSVGEQA